ncbi:MAG TPA: carboxypeptidase regulatory-like domain-containing protein [Pyrinomonadaceae bacterium]|nr:carboxypeptidase regulatory-like domain-containing protein [Pyrinomonadaceae bacterium]
MRPKSRSSRRVAAVIEARAGQLTALVLTIAAGAALAFTNVSQAEIARPSVRHLPAQLSANTLTRRSLGDDDQGQQPVDRQDPRRRPNPYSDGAPREWRIKRGSSFDGDVRGLPRTRPARGQRLELPGREQSAKGEGQSAKSEQYQAGASEQVASFALSDSINAPAPPPTSSFDGLDFQNSGSGHPPSANGDVGPNYYIQAINTSIGIFDKANGNLVAVFGFNSFMSQGQFGNLCDTNNMGEPVVLYDSFEDRWVISDYAFQLSGGGVANPPGSYQCIAVSKSGDPVAGGWNFYSLHLTDLLNAYPKFGIWPDGIYLSANLYGFPAGGAYQNPRVWALNKMQMYSGAATVQAISFDAPPADFTLLPSNARLQTGTPPPGTPNLFISTWQFTDGVGVYKFHVDWDHTALSSFTGPIKSAAPSRPGSAPAAAPSQGGNDLDVVGLRAMMQNQYTNLAGVESLWATHTVRRGDDNGFAAPRFYQVPVNSGTVGANVTQAATLDPDGDNVIHRFMPSLAVDRAGNMALGYSTSSSDSKPAIKYAGRLSSDPLNTFGQSEQVMVQGAGAQTGNCEGALCTSWGDYSAMTLDPDGCTFWYTNMYYQADGINYQTRIGSFTLPQCLTVNSGALQGTVTSSSGGVAIPGATVTLGSRTATTDANGFYSFPNLAAGTYPSVSVAFAGYVSSAVSSLVIDSGVVRTQNFVLGPAPDAACLTDTSQIDFQRGGASSVDLNSSPGDVVLSSTASIIDQQNLSIGASTFAFNSNIWVGQTFQPAVTGQLSRAELFLFCTGCTGTTPDLTISIRATSGDLPTGPDLASATIAGFSSSTGAFHGANFSSPPALTAGTRYAVIVRPTSNPSVGSYGYQVSSSNIYATGRWVASSNSGSTWSAPTVGTSSRDLGFKTFMQSGFVPSGNLSSGVFDANPHAGGAVSWTTLSWNAATPNGTSVQFQVAASNSLSGPFNFAGPDGTASSFFTTSGASLSQFNGLRYLKYQAFLASSVSSSTPTLNDVTVCFSNSVPSVLTVSAATATYGGVANLSATLTDGVSPLAGRSISFTLNGANAGSAVTDAAGVASLANVTLAGVNAGNYPAGVGATFAGDPPYLNSSNAGPLTVNKAEAQIVVTPYNVAFDGNAHSATGSATGVNHEALAGLNLTGTNHTDAGDYAGDQWKFTDVTGNYHDAGGAVDDVISKASSTTSVTAGDATYDGNAHGATASVNGIGGLNQTVAVTYAGRNSTVYGPVNVPPTGAGEYRASASYAGDSNHSSSSDAKDFTIFKAASITKVSCPANVSATGQPLTPCTAAATGAGGLNVPVAVSYSNNVLPGTATATAKYDGDQNHSGSSGSATFTITAVSAPTGYFVIGDLNAVVGKKVTFWGAQWAKLNSLSSGSAPADFKGFANSSSTNPASCGGAWASDPGNSSGPPSQVPELITVIVSSSITKKGSQISGNNYKLVVVRTDPGYGPDPGHAGTGTVVSVICQ